MPLCSIFPSHPVCISNQVLTYTTLRKVHHPVRHLYFGNYNYYYDYYYCSLWT